VLAVHGAERVVDVRVGEARELPGERTAYRVVLAGLARVEAQVLQQQHLSVLQGRGGRLSGLTDGVLGEDHRVAEKVTEALGDRREGVLGVRRALGTAEVRAHDHPRAGVTQCDDGRQDRADPAVVADHGLVVLVERDVQVGAQQHAPTRDTLAEQVVESLQSCQPTSLTRSTRRLE
jgi:hypothetical protein